MIQRIQSVYFFAVIGLISSMLLYPLATLTMPTGEILKFDFLGIASLEKDGQAIYNAYPIAILFVLILLLTLASLFLFKKRMLQIRLSIINVLLMIGSVGLVYFNVNDQEKALNAISSYSIINVFPLIAVVFTYFAIRAIGKDEALLRSVNRIR